MELDNYLPLKSGSTGLLNICICGRVSKVVLPKGAEAYAFRYSQYVEEAVNNVVDYLDNQGMRFSMQASTTLSPSYWPEMDATPELSPVDSS